MEESETYSATAFILLLFSLHPIQFISLENPRSWSRFLHLPFFFFPGLSWIFPMLFSKGWHLVLGGWVVVQKTYVTLYRWCRPKNYIVGLCYSTHSRFFSTFLFPKRVENLAFFFYFSTAPKVIGNSHCSLGTKDEKREFSSQDCTKLQYRQNG